MVTCASQFGGFQLDDKRFTVSGPAGPVHVEPQVFELLHSLIVKTVHGRGYQFVAAVRADAGRFRPALPRLRNVPIGRDGDIKSVAERVRSARW